MSEAMTLVPLDNPMRAAWERHKETEEYANSRKWALHPEAGERQYVDGSMWAAFCAGWAAAGPQGEERGHISDGYHTFDELYEHRHWLFLTVLGCNQDKAWASRLHSDGTSFDGWFIAGLELLGKQITYHLPERLWEMVEGLGITVERAPKWDGHTSEDVIARLKDWVSP